MISVAGQNMGLRTTLGAMKSTPIRLVKLTFGVELIPTETILRYNER